MLRCTRSLRRGGAILATVVLAAVGASDAFAARSAAAASVDVQLLGFNDFHGNLDPATAGSVSVPPVPPATTPTSVPAGGAAYLAAHLHALRASNPNTLIVTAGDNFGASPLVSALFHDEPTVQALNLMRVDLASVGNHEFDDGLAELQRMQYGGCFPTDRCTDPTQTYLGADFSYLAANVVEAGTGTPVFPPYAIRTVAGIKIGFIGVVTKDDAHDRLAGRHRRAQVPRRGRHGQPLRARAAEARRRCDRGAHPRGRGAGVRAAPSTTATASPARSWTSPTRSTTTST